MKTFSIVAALVAIACIARSLWAKPASADTSEEETTLGLRRQPVTYVVPTGDCCDGFPHCGCYRIG
jgi:hypothetical protein